MYWIKLCQQVRKNYKIKQNNVLKKILNLITEHHNTGMADIANDNWIIIQRSKLREE